MKQLLIFLSLLLWYGSAFSQHRWKKVSEELLFTTAPFTACHASSLVELAPGKIMVAFFAGAHEGSKDVSIWAAVKTKKQWSKPVVLADGRVHDSLRFPCWNPVLFKSSDGRLFLFYKVGPNPREWWGMYRTSLNNGATWTAPVRLPPGLLGPIKNKPVQLPNGSILNPSSVETALTWRVHIEKSRDGGNTWEKIPIDTGSGFKVIQPAILQYGNNRLQLLCRSDQDRIVTAWSDNAGESWSAFSALELPNPNSGIDAATLHDGTQLLVYNPTVQGKEWFNNRGTLSVAVSTDGANWKQILTLEKGGNEEYSYPAVIQASDRKVHITYTYNRTSIKHVVLSY